MRLLAERQLATRCLQGSGHFAGFIGQYVFNDTSQGVQPVFRLDQGLPAYKLPPSIDPAFSNGNDVDFYRFTVDYDLIQAIAGVNASGKSFATIIDLDYADGLARPDAVISLYDETGKLILVARDSDILDDQAAPFQGIDIDDLTRGTAGKLDPYIGSVELPAGIVKETGDGTPPTGYQPTGSRTYYLAVSSNGRLPQVMNGTFVANATSPLLRLEPVSSIRRIVEDHIGFDGYQTGSIITDTYAVEGLVDETRGEVVVEGSGDERRERCPHVDVGMADEVDQQRLWPHVAVAVVRPLAGPDVIGHQEPVEGACEPLRLGPDDLRRVPVGHDAEVRPLAEHAERRGSETVELGRSPAER